MNVEFFYFGKKPKEKKFCAYIISFKYEADLWEVHCFVKSAYLENRWILLYSQKRK